MAALTVADVKAYLRIAGTEEDTELTALMSAADSVIRTQTGKNYIGTNDINTDEMFKTAQKQIVATWYSNREEAVAGSVVQLPHSAEAIIDLIKWSSKYAVSQ